jgi:hypothetical protein
MDNLEEKRNMVFYNQIINDQRRKALAQKHKERARSFGSQKVDFKEYLFIPQNWEFLAYIIYVVVIPYLVGLLFLFITIAGASFENFKLLDTSAFLIVWAIGYEIVAIVSLVWIMKLYLQYDTDE